MTPIIVQCVQAYRRLDHRRVQRERLRRGLTIWLAAAMAGLGLDVAWTAIGAISASDATAVISMPVALRLAIAVSLGVGLVGLVIQLVIAEINQRSADCHDARQLETRCNIDANLLVNGWAFASGKHTDKADLAQHLRQRCIDHANERARMINVRSLVDMTTARHWGRACSLLAGIFVLLFVIDATWLGGAAVGRASARLVAPWRSAPPPALCRVFTSHIPDPIGLGDDVLLEAVTAGLEPERVHLQWLGRSGGVEQSAAMLRRPSGDTWAATLANLTEPVQLRLIAGGSYFGPISLTPHPRPKLLAVRLTTTRQADAPSPSSQTITLSVGQLDHTVAVPAKAFVNITVVSDQPDARLAGHSDHALALAHRVKAGRQTIVLDLISAEGLRSTGPATLHLIGVTDAQLADLRDARAEATGEPGQARSESPGAPAPLILTNTQRLDEWLTGDGDGTLGRARPATLVEGTPTRDVNGQQGSPRPDQPTGQAAVGPTSDQSQPGRTGGTGERHDTPDTAPTTGTRIIKVEPQPALDPDVRLLIDQTPPAYRQVVEAYLRRLDRDLQESLP